jgi:putative ABC transport system substrate-binding protein
LLRADEVDLVNRRLALLALALSFASGIAVLGSPPAPAADPAQKILRVGFVGPASLSTAPRALTAFWERLRELGYVEGENLVVERLWAEGQYDRLPALMAEMVGREVDVLVTYSTPAALAAKNATTTIPIVGAVMGEPVRTGLVASLARPGGNLTGLSVGWTEGIGGKWLECLQEIVPHLSTIALITNQDNPMLRDLAKDVATLAWTRRLKVRIVDVRQPDALEHAFEQARQHAQAVLVFSDPVTVGNQRRITTLAAKHRLPAVYALRDFVDAGGLMAYGPDFPVLYRRAAEYVDKILKGASPADLPIEQPTQYVLVVNLKTARSLGIRIPQSILVRADEVIQ